jgi:hypothetical protein
MTIKMNMAGWFVKIPEITLRNVTEEAQKLQEEAQKLQTEGKDLKDKDDSTAQAVNADARNSTANLYDCIKNCLVENRHKVVQDFQRFHYGPTHMPIRSITSCDGKPKPVFVSSFVIWLQPK